MVIRGRRRHEPEWRKCDECDDPYILVAVRNPRLELYSLFPLSRAPEGVQGNFELTDHEEEISAPDGSLHGSYAVAVYGRGEYLPHRVSHFLDDVHTGEVRQRMNNFAMAMDSP
jgi:hypothetical protein